MDCKHETPCCYLLKLSECLGTEKHSAIYYLGSCGNLNKRLDQHKQGTAAAFTRAARNRGITFEVVRVWVTTTVKEARQLERKLKKSKNHARLLHSNKLSQFTKNEKN